MSWLERLSEIRDRDWSEASDEEREAKAHEVVNICSYAAGLTALVPVPLADLALLLPVHSVMVMTLGHVHGRPVSQTEAKRIVLELGAVAGVAFAGTAAISALRRLVLPGLGGVLSVSATFALTWGLGRVSISYFENPELSRDELKKVFNEAMKEGKKTFSKDAFENFRKKNQDVKAPPVDSVPPEPAQGRAEPKPEPTSEPKKGAPLTPDEPASSPDPASDRGDQDSEPPPTSPEDPAGKRNKRTM